MPLHEISLPTRVMGKILFRSIAELSSRGVIIEGRENIPKVPPFLMGFNHFGWVEGLVPHMLLPVKDFPYTITKIENTNGTLGKIMTTFGFIGVRRGEADMHAIRQAIEVLKAGHVLATAPEGTRGRGGERLQSKAAKGGLVFLSTRFNPALPIVPIAIWGQNEKTFPLFGVKRFDFQDLKDLRQLPLHINIGQPFIPNTNGGGNCNSEMRNCMSNELLQRIHDLLPPEYV